MTTQCAADRRLRCLELAAGLTRDEQWALDIARDYAAFVEGGGLSRANVDAEPEPLKLVKDPAEGLRPENNFVDTAFEKVADIARDKPADAAAPELDPKPDPEPPAPKPVPEPVSVPPGDLPPKLFDLLQMIAVLRRQGEAATYTALSEALEVVPMTVSKRAAKLSVAGMVTLPGIGRRQGLIPTEAGKQLLARYEAAPDNGDDDPPDPPAAAEAPPPRRQDPAVQAAGAVFVTDRGEEQRLIDAAVAAGKVTRCPAAVVAPLEGNPETGCRAPSYIAQETALNLADARARNKRARKSRGLR